MSYAQLKTKVLSAKDAVSRAYATVVCMALMSASESRAAGWSFTGIKNLASDGIDTLVIVFFLAGVGAFGFAGKKLWDKGQEGRGDDIKAMHIIWPMVGGAFLMSLSFIANNTIGSIGGPGASSTISH